MFCFEKTVQISYTLCVCDFMLFSGLRNYYFWHFNLSCLVDSCCESSSLDLYFSVYDICYRS